MSVRNRSTQLTGLIEGVIEKRQLGKFEEYWELYESTCPVTSVEAFYVRTEMPNGAIPTTRGGYCNVAVIGDGLLVDIEGNDGDGSGNLTVQPLKSFSGVSIRTEPLKNFAPTQGASLVVLANRFGEEGVGLHWVAKTEEDEEHLLEFVKFLIQAISKSSA